MIQQFFTDLAADSGAERHVHDRRVQRADGAAPVRRGHERRRGSLPGRTRSTTRPATDSIDDTDPYPAQSAQCASPSGIATCITDGQVSTEVDQLVQGTSGHPARADEPVVRVPATQRRRMHPAQPAAPTASPVTTRSRDVSEHGATIYAVAIDPIIEVDDPAGRRSRGLPRRRGGDQRRRARDRRGDDRPRGRRLDGPERVRGRRQVRDARTARRSASPPTARRSTR